jgi:uncharacterized protein YkwD
MGRHRRTANRIATEGRAAAPIDPHPQRAHRGAHRHHGRGAGHVRTGLLGASAVAAMGVVTVASGVLPGNSSYSPGGDGSTRVRSADSPSALMTGTGGPVRTVSRSPSPHEDGARTTRRTPLSSSRSAPRPSLTRTSASPPHTSKPPATPTHSATEDAATRTPSGTPSARTTGSPSPMPSSSQSAAEAQVLTLVNRARGKAGCSALRSNTALADLAGAFSAAMADEGFFSHTDPQGRTPWDRAAKAGITDLGGENIARGQPDAKAVMDSWMASPGHRANILNCSYRTTGIGVQFGAGGPWWTEDFGF